MMEKLKQDLNNLLQHLRDFEVLDLVHARFNPNPAPFSLLLSDMNKVQEHLNNLDKLIEKERKEASAKTANDIGWNAGGINW